MTIAAIEGAVIMSVATRSTRPLDRVGKHLTELLRRISAKITRENLFSDNKTDYLADHRSAAERLSEPCSSYKIEWPLITARATTRMITPGGARPPPWTVDVA